MVLLDKLLPKLKERDSRVLIFSQYTIEEKVIGSAYKKLALDALVIQQGRLAEQKVLNKDELLQMVRFGAEIVFCSKDSTIIEEGIDQIIAKGEEATAELDAKMKKFTEDDIKFKMDDNMPMTLMMRRMILNLISRRLLMRIGWIEPPKRERKQKVRLLQASNVSGQQPFKTKRTMNPWNASAAQQRNQSIDSIGDSDELKVPHSLENLPVANSLYIV